MECVSRQELWAILSLLVAIIAVFVAVLVVPDFRAYVGLDAPLPTPEQRRRRRIMVFLVWMLIWMSLGFLLWLLLCPWIGRSPSPCAETRPTPEHGSDEPRTNASPTPFVALTPTPVAKSSPLGEPDEGLPIEVYEPMPVTDPNSKRAECDFYIFERDHYWQIGTNNVLFNNASVSDKQMAEYVSRIHGGMGSVDAIVSVGTASNIIGVSAEGEESRALQRARKLNSWVRVALKDSPKPPALYLLNLGHYGQPPDVDTQRLIIIIGVRKIDPDADLNQILSKENKEKLRRQLMAKKFPFNFYEYSKFDIEPES
jgi:hypothetical protein